MSSGISLVNFAPSPNPSQANFTPTDSPRIFSSQETANTHIQRRNNHRWTAEMSWSGASEAEAWSIMAQLERFGQGTVFNIYPVDQPTVTGDATDGQLDTVVVNGAGQTGRELIISTTGVLNTLLFKAGDIIGFKDSVDLYQMFRVYSNCTTNGSGVATVQLCQYIRSSPDTGDPVYTRYVPLTVYMPSPVQRSASPPVQYDISASFIEAVFA